MTPELEAHVTERQREIALLRELYGFSPQEARDFIESFPKLETVKFHVEQAA